MTIFLFLTYMFYKGGDAIYGMVILITNINGQDDILDGILASIQADLDSIILKTDQWINLTKIPMEPRLLPFIYELEDRAKAMKSGCQIYKDQLEVLREREVL